MKIPILLLTHDRPFLLNHVIDRILKYTNWQEFELWILDNASTISNKKIIDAYVNKYSEIKLLSTQINELSIIQNKAIKKLKSDVYIKIDDDILVTENWTDGLVGVLNRNYSKISLGSVVIPINTFGWKLFLSIMGLKNEFKKLFPLVNFNNRENDTSVLSNPAIVEYIWKNSLPLDEVYKKFIENQKGDFTDYICPHRYSIGAIIFTRSIWENMGMWRIGSAFNKKIKMYNSINSLLDVYKKIRKKKKAERLELITKILLNLHKSALGVDEQQIFEFSKKNNLKMMVTTQSLVFHFSYHTTEEHLMRNIYLDLIKQI